MELEQLLEHENAERILEEGWRLFQQKGYRGLAMDELCRVVGISKPTLYYYFEDKETLFVRVLQYQLQGFRSAIEQEGSLEERLANIATQILDSFQTAYTVMLRDREHIKKSDNLQMIRSAFHEKMFAPLIALMETGMRAGELQQGDAHFLSLVFLGIINQFIGRSAEEGLDNRALAKRLCAYFLDGARVR